MGKRRKTRSQRRQSGATGRFSAETKAEILGQVDMGRTRAEVAEQYGCHPVSIARWLKRRDEEAEAGHRTGKSGLEARSTRPVHAETRFAQTVRALIPTMSAMLGA